jgi:adenylate cyclase
MPDDSDPPRKVYGLKPREFDRANTVPPSAPTPAAPAPSGHLGPAASPDRRIDVHEVVRAGAGSVPQLGSNKVANRANEVHGILRDNLRHGLAAGHYDLGPLDDSVRRRRIRRYWIAIAAIDVPCGVLALGLARSVSEPVRQLAAHTEKIAGGDYATRISLARADELGQLAEAMNAMSAGLAERDQVRDLLDKNVSPEVAAQLMRDGAALGGQEREVTILFADLRGFTTLSEQLPARELLTLLNRYLDRMSTAIEAQGGVIDKFIGDGIMALFGAPVAQGDAADRALAAALAMERALAELNRELAAEGRPPLAIGIGVNTARVVAGNIGSQRRLNYSVVGEGVNIAARLESLTRTAEYRTNIIARAATKAACHRGPSSISNSPTPNFRPLGTVPVKGRAEPVEIFAIG